MPGDGGTGRRSAATDAGCTGLASTKMRLVVPYSPGGGYDMYARLLEPFLERGIGSEVVIDNRPGGGGRVGVRLIHDAEPDGTTLGIVNAAGLLIQGLLGEARSFDPMTDFTPIGRIAVADPVLVAAGGSPLGSWEQLRAAPADRPLVFGVGGVSDPSWVWFVIASELLHLDVTYVAGYPGTRESSLGLIRGEFDLAGYTFESMLDRIASGDLGLVAQISPHPGYPILRGVPVVTGADGLAAQRAVELGQDPVVATRRAAALDRIFQAGRLIVAPPGLEPALARCLRERLAEVAADGSFLAAASKAGRTVEFADPAAIAAELDATAQDRNELGAVFRRHLGAARSGGPAIP